MIIHRRYSIVLTLLMLLPMAADCDKRSQPQGKITPPTTQPAPIVSSAPTTQPATPKSTYNSKPPYPVKLYVTDPEEKQPGWLKVLGLKDKDAPATTVGTFPERNRIDIETNNVNLLRIHIAHLPLAQGKRIVLHIDGQGIELAHKGRTYVLLERGTTGSWRVLK